MTSDTDAACWRHLDVTYYCAVIALSSHAGAVARSSCGCGGCRACADPRCAGRVGFLFDAVLDAAMRIFCLPCSRVLLVQAPPARRLYRMWTTERPGLFASLHLCFIFAPLHMRASRPMPQTAWSIVRSFRSPGRRSSLAPPDGISRYAFWRRPVLYLASTRTSSCPSIPRHPAASDTPARFASSTACCTLGGNSS